MNPFQVVKDFEKAVAEYTGAPYCVAVNSCTNALFLCIEYMKTNAEFIEYPFEVEIPKHTYISVPMQIIHAGGKVKFRNEDWSGAYQLRPFPIWDAARRFTTNMWLKVCDEDINSFPFVCISHHWHKILGIQQGGCILHNNNHADKWFRKARFDGRTEDVAPKDDKFDQLGWHMYMSPEIAAEGLVRLYHLPKYNSDLPNDDYPNLSQMDIFK